MRVFERVSEKNLAPRRRCAGGDAAASRSSGGCFPAVLYKWLALCTRICSHPERILDGQHCSLDKELLHSLRRARTLLVRHKDSLLERASKASSNWSNGAAVAPA
jgi:hypothetical protein